MVGGAHTQTDIGIVTGNGILTDIGSANNPSIFLDTRIKSIEKIGGEKLHE
jgi:hypothetical protein